MKIDPEKVVAELTALVGAYAAAGERKRFPGINNDQRVVVERAAAAIERYAPIGSRYRVNMESAFAKGAPHLVISVASALRDDWRDGALASFTELVHGEVFSNLVDQAAHLVEQGYKDPAAVIAGAVLEEHLRQLATKASIALADAKGMPKRAGLLNDELAKAKVYEIGDQKQVTAWQDLRNKAAHGDFGAFTAAQVDLFIRGLRDFLVRNPA